jgi:PAS domain S-box-containing protein
MGDAHRRTARRATDKTELADIERYDAGGDAVMRSELYVPAIVKGLFDAAEALNHALLIVDPATGKIVMSNHIAASFFGYWPGEMEELTVENLIPEALGGTHMEHRRHYMLEPSARKMGERLDLIAVKKNGDTFAVSVCLVPLRKVEGYEQPLVLALAHMSRD